MYREHLKMARGEGEPGIRSHFVERVVRLPMVHVAWDYATNTYTQIKESNKLVKFTLTNAEKSVNFVAGQAKPVVLKFEKQIQVVDSLACKGLGTLEEKVPFITKPAEEIIDDTRKLYTNTVHSRLEGIRKYGTDKVKSVTDYGLEKANFVVNNPLVHSVLTSVAGYTDLLLVETENYVDHFLPPTKEEKKKDGKEEDKSKRSALSRLGHISNKVRHRVYRSLLLKIEYAQERTLELILTYPLGMIELSKGYVETLLQYASQLWASLKQTESDDKEAEEKFRIQQQLLHLARLLSRQMVDTYSSFIPPDAHEPTEADTLQEPSQPPVALSVVRDSTLWVIGMIRLIPHLLPMYIYGFVSWLDNKRNDKKSKVVQDEKQEVRENGTVPREHNSCANSNSSHTYAHKNEQNCNSSIPEEDES